MNTSDIVLKACGDLPTEEMLSALLVEAKSDSFLMSLLTGKESWGISLSEFNADIKKGDAIQKVRVVTEEFGWWTFIKKGKKGLFLKLIPTAEVFANIKRYAK